LGYIKHLNDTFGGAELKTYPHYDYYDYMVRFPHRQRIQRFPLLNYIDFNKMEAMEIMKRELHWTPYGGKHYESIYTRFYQGYILPKKFGFDKRRSHLSCLVANGRMTRDEALAEIQKPALSEEMEREDRAFVAKKLGLSDAEFDEIMNAERKTFWDYPSSERDLPGTEIYKKYINAAHFHSGEWARTMVGRLNSRLISVQALHVRAWKRMHKIHTNPKDVATSLGRFTKRAAVSTGSSLLRNTMKLTIPLIRPVGNLARSTLSPDQFASFKRFAIRLYAGGRVEPAAPAQDVKEQA
jgi:hypothetical protein